MPEGELALSVRGVSKSYTLRRAIEPGATTLAEEVVQRVRSPFRRVARETFWALNDVSFDICQGEVVGIIGRNGAGKSTLLKVLSRITEPTTGCIELYGRVGALLEVGTGFHPELTGRENIFLNGQILGMRRREIARQFDAIVDFAGVEQFLDTPVKRYSSGMYVRLAFAVAAHLEPEIMLVDEVLAVGDEEFQRKCLGKMKDVARSGRTVIFVSHQMQSIAKLCTRAICMERGRVAYAGAVDDTIDHYLESLNRASTSTESEDAGRRGGNGDYRFASAGPAKASFRCGEEKVVRFAVRRRNPGAGRFSVRCNVVDERGVTLLQCDSRLTGYRVAPTDLHEGEVVIRNPWLKPGEYTVDLFVIGELGVGFIDKFETACRFQVANVLPYPYSTIPAASAEGVVFADFAYADTSAPQAPDAPVVSGQCEPEPEPSLH